MEKNLKTEISKLHTKLDKLLTLVELNVSNNVSVPDFIEDDDDLKMPLESMADIILFEEKLIDKAYVKKMVITSYTFTNILIKLDIYI